ncbi:glycoside hydrolase family 79 protein [Lanmaoa asiatica]|nr:glycoside hydrolase family 79 protein [Lanmaoa asiatica]
MLGLYRTILLASLTPLVTSAINVTIPLTAPSGAASVAPDLVSLSIEQDRWVDWAGPTEQNQFFHNALDNLVQITNSPPFIRIGANSEDHTDFSHGVQVYLQPTRFQLECLIGTRVHWGINLRQYNLTVAYLETKALIQAFGSPAVKANGITLNFIEVGNEADLYYKNGGRNSSWSVFEYVPQWVQFATNVSETAGLSKTSFTKLIGAAFAGSSHNNISGFSPQAIFVDGILDTLPGTLITTISQHQYSGSFCTGSGAVLQDLMTKNYIRGNITAFEPDINATFAHGLEYILGETNRVCWSSNIINLFAGVSNTAGAALWALDYSLFATQVGISRLHFHEGIGYKYNFVSVIEDEMTRPYVCKYKIQPVTLNYSILDGSPITPLPPHIQPPYYAAIVAAEAIGSTGSAQVVEIPVNATDISGYAVFEYGNLARAVFINSAAYLPSGGVRTTTHINIDFSGSGLTVREMKVKKLNITYANATSGITWGGQTYETANARVSGLLQVETLDVSTGLDVQETEAVLLSFL